MAKKQVSISVNSISRYFDRQESLNFVMKNKSVYLACPIAEKSGILKVKNTKGHILHLPLAQIEEIWAEIKAD